MYVVYVGANEVIVCTDVEGEEEQMLHEFFHHGGRDVDEYDRSTQEDPVSILNAVRLR